MNLHINVIRGCCVHGYFQQRGWEDVKHAKPFCIYANWAPFSNLNMNLAEMNLFTSSLLRDQSAFLHMHTNCTAAYMPSAHLCSCSWVRSEIIGCKLGHEKLWIPSDFCCLIICSRDTANIAVISGNEKKARRQAEHRMSAQMQISDSEAYAKEVNLSQIITHCKNIYGLKINKSSSSGNYTDA